MSLTSPPPPTGAPPQVAQEPAALAVLDRLVPPPMDPFLRLLIAVVLIGVTLSVSGPVSQRFPKFSQDVIAVSRTVPWTVDDQGMLTIEGSISNGRNHSVRIDGLIMTGAFAELAGHSFRDGRTGLTFTRADLPFELGGGDALAYSFKFRPQSCGDGTSWGRLQIEIEDGAGRYRFFNERYWDSDGDPTDQSIDYGDRNQPSPFMTICDELQR